MKITTNECIYIGKTDLLYLKNINYPMPKEINNKVHKKVIKGEDTSSDFVKFDTGKEIEFFNDMDWILEYDAVVNMSIDDINRSSEEIIEEQSSMSRSNLKFKRSIDRFDILNLKIKSLRDALLFKKGLLQVKLPKEIKIFYPGTKKSFIKKIKEKISNIAY